MPLHGLSGVGFESPVNPYPLQAAGSWESVTATLGRPPNGILLGGMAVQGGLGVVGSLSTTGYEWTLLLDCFGTSVACQLWLGLPLPGTKGAATTFSTSGTVGENPVVVELGTRFNGKPFAFDYGVTNQAQATSITTPTLVPRHKGLLGIAFASGYPGAGSGISSGVTGGQWIDVAAERVLYAMALAYAPRGVPISARFTCATSRMMSAGIVLLGDADRRGA